MIVVRNLGHWFVLTLAVFLASCELADFEDEQLVCVGTMSCRVLTVSVSLDVPLNQACHVATLEDLLSR